MLSIDQLVCKRDERALFEPISDQLNGGDCVEVLGPNGAGKTTLLRTLAGLYTQFDGAFANVGAQQDFLYQGHRAGLDELMSPLENLQWYGAMQGLKHDENTLLTVLQRVDMAALAFTECQRLSQGQQRRICMARWLLSPASLWLLDEPYTSLDVAGQRLLNELLEEHCAAGGAVLAATHVSLTAGTPRSLQVVPLAGQDELRGPAG